ncbi:hypothetical protein [Flavobacterium gelatinilyticum]|uniref:hypothetical protein n=1 Tax=Flavobacterium gelatinilyticum TaxID=3003260 RepID=UPI002480968A|nr:hypothetical protein [Flavobacterium gelatinilyticum]
MLQIATKFKVPCFTEGLRDAGLGRFWVYSEFSAGGSEGEVEEVVLAVGGNDVGMMREGLGGSGLCFVFRFDIVFGLIFFFELFPLCITPEQQ